MPPPSVRSATRYTGRPCPTCGCRVPRNKYGRPKIYCSPPCRKHPPTPPERTHCRNGHRLLGNRFLHPNGSIGCRVCADNRREQERQWREVRRSWVKSYGVPDLEWFFDSLVYK